MRGSLAGGSGDCRPPARVQAELARAELNTLPKHKNESPAQCRFCQLNNNTTVSVPIFVSS